MQKVLIARWGFYDGGIRREGKKKTNLRLVVASFNHVKNREEDLLASELKQTCG
jgi:hypothetical protein